MQYLKFITAAGVLAAGLATPAISQQMGEWNLGVGAQASELQNNAYRPGFGVNGSVGYEKPFGMLGLADLGLKANYVNYRIEGDEIGKDLNEGGVNLRGLLGPNSAYFQPKLGGHAGYARVEESDFFDVGVDVLATYRLTPRVGVQAGVVPTWLINDDSNDYQTKVSLGVEWTPGG